MEQKKYFFAVDLGATSGRTIIGSLSDGKFNLEELTRFDNNLIETGGHFYWDIYALYYEIIKGLTLGDATSYMWARTELSFATRWHIATLTPSA